MNKMNRLEKIEAKLKKHIEVLKKAQVEYICLVHELKGIELKGTYKVICDTTRFVVYDEKGNVIYFEDSKGFWVKRKYDEKGNEIYYENSEGKIIDSREKELTIEEIEKLLGYKIKIKGERK